MFQVILLQFIIQEQLSKKDKLNKLKYILKQHLKWKFLFKLPPIATPN
jgi:hypothetical protein